MCFAICCRYFGSNNKLIEERYIDVILWRKHHWNLHLKCAIVSSYYCIAHHCSLISHTVSSPPPTLFAFNGVYNFGSLHRHTSVTTGCSCHHDGVTGGILFFVFVNFNLEFRTFELFNTNNNNTSFALKVCLYRIASCQSALWKDEVGRQCAVVICINCFLDYVLVVGI